MGPARSPEPLDGLVIDDLAPPEVLTELAWEGSPTHLKAVVEAVERAQRGEVDYLVARLGDLVVGAGGVDFVPDPAAGELWQLAVRPGWQSRGIGTAMIRALEARITARGRAAATLKVEVDNARARALYSRLGYRVVRPSVESWEIGDADGRTRTYSTDCLVLRHDLNLSHPRGGEGDEPLTPAGSSTTPPVGVRRAAERGAEADCCPYGCQDDVNRVPPVPKAGPDGCTDAGWASVSGAGGSWASSRSACISSGETMPRSSFSLRLTTTVVRQTVCR